MRVIQAAAKIEGVQSEYVLGDPLAVVYIFEDDATVLIGNEDRDREKMSENLIRVAAEELAGVKG